MDNLEKRSRRRHSAQLKERVLAQCEPAGVSVAKVALAHGLNANLVHKWRRDRAAAGFTPAPAPAPAPQFIALPASIQASPALACEAIRIELRRGATSATVTWPIPAA